MLTRVAVLVSGGGTNLQAIIDFAKEGKLRDGKIVAVISTRPDAYALKRAENAGIYNVTIDKKRYLNRDDFENALIAELDKVDADLIVLAGFMTVLSKNFVSKYENRIINVHPSLIPSFCGDGYYGLKVHEAALNYGVKVTGATVHYVNEVTDGGKIIMQKAVKVRKGDTPEVLQRRVMEQAEWKILPTAVQKICKEIKEARN